MNLGDPELELIDPTPNVHTLFLHFDKLFFWTKLASRAVVRWSKRMYSCAGICSYEGRGGLCDIALSEPLLKLRPRKDLVETLLHEMIHAFLFVTNRDQDRDGHGPNFKEHMHRINKSAGLNITIYHSFHDEVELYQNHWWRCNGPCQTRRPHYGIVRRSMNRAPGPSDFWWNAHKYQCGGTFVKIKEPEKKQKPAGKKTITSKPNADITKYINNNVRTINDNPNTNDKKPILKDSSNVMANIKTKTNSSSTLVVSKKGVVFNPTAPKPAKPIPVFTGSGNTINNGRSRSNTIDVTETVRNVWANKQLPTTVNNETVNKTDINPFTNKTMKSVLKEPDKKVAVSNPKKHKAESTNSSPPPKMKKIEDYFKASTILKELYGEDYKLTQSSTSTKLVAVTVKVDVKDLVDCPICNSKVSNEEINRHLDECLNKDVIEKLSKDEAESAQDIRPIQVKTENQTKLKDIVGELPTIPTFKGKTKSINNNVVDLTNLNVDIDDIDKGKIKTESLATLESLDIDKMKSLVKEFDSNTTSIETNTQPSKSKDKRRNTVSFVTTDRGDFMANNVKVESIEKVVSEAGSSFETFEQICPCCLKKFDKPVDEHLDECLVFFDNNKTMTDDGAGTSYSNNTTIVLDNDDDDVFDESQLLNATGTKTPCPCCMEMVEQDDMNDHLDLCLK